MSRFDTGRRLRIAVWTGAAIAWGTTATMAVQRTAIAASAGDGSSVVPAREVSQVELADPVPTMPDAGLVVLRYQPSPEVQAEVRTVYVQAASPPPAAAPSAPQPTSSGS